MRLLYFFEHVYHNITAPYKHGADEGERNLRQLRAGSVDMDPAFLSGLGFRIWYQVPEGDAITLIVR